MDNLELKIAIAVNFGFIAFNVIVLKILIYSIYRQRTSKGYKKLESELDKLEYMIKKYRK